MASVRRVWRAAKRGASYVNRSIALRGGDRVPFHPVCEYPRSGGTWLCRMIADCLDLPFPQNPVLPCGFPCVLHTHWPFDARFRRAVYLVRDGRDVMVSALFDQFRRVHEEPGLRPVLCGLDEGIDAPVPTDDDVRRILPAFIEKEFRRPFGTRVNWAAHVLGWWAPDERPGVVFVRYEDLRRDCRGTLTRVVTAYAGREIDPWRIEMAVEKFSMERATGRRPGEEARGAFIRKGIVGDWRTHFTAEAAAVFDRSGGTALRRLGYAGPVDAGVDGHRERGAAGAGAARPGPDAPACLLDARASTGRWTGDDDGPGG